ncbi:unnamed protein product [Merluccius merluccius]
MLGKSTASARCDGQAEEEEEEDREEEDDEDEGAPGSSRDDDDRTPKVTTLWISQVCALLSSGLSSSLAR